MSEVPKDRNDIKHKQRPDRGKPELSEVLNSGAASASSVQANLNVIRCSQRQIKMQSMRRIGCRDGGKDSPSTVAVTNPIFPS